MNKHIKSLYPWARNYDKGGPIKRQNLLAGIKTPEQIAAETMSVAENTKTQSSIGATEQRLQANKTQKDRIQQQLSQQSTEIKPQNENPLHYASTNPLTQQIASLDYINEQNPQTWYRPGYDYQQQYFSPETREQAKNDMSNFTSLLFGATFPEMLPFLAAYSGNELFNDDEQSKQDINTAINTAGFFAGGTHSVRDFFNRGKNVAKNTVEQVKLAKNFKPRQITQEGDFVFEPFRGQDENLIGSVFYNKRDLQHKSGSKYGQKNILGRGLEKVLRGGIKSDVYVEKSLMDQANLPDVKLNSLKKINRGFKSTFGKDANPKDYYRISTEQLLTSKIPNDANEQKVYDAISNQIVPQLKTKASKQVVPVFYNPKTAKSPGSVLRLGLYGLPATTALSTAFNTTASHIGQWRDYKGMQDRLQDPDYADFQELYYDLPQQDRDNISVIVSNYLNNPYELETKQQFDTLVDAFEQQYGEKGLKMLNAYVKYQTPSYSNPVQIHPIDATKSFVNDRIYQFSSDDEESNNIFAKGGPKKTYTAEQLTAMVNAQRDAEFADMSPMSSTYNGPKVVETDKTKTPSKLPPKVKPLTEEELKDDPAAYVKEKSKYITGTSPILKPNAAMEDLELAAESIADDTQYWVNARSRKIFGMNSIEAQEAFKTDPVWLYQNAIDQYNKRTSFDDNRREFYKNDLATYANNLLAAFHPILNSIYRKFYRKNIKPFNESSNGLLNQFGRWYSRKYLTPKNGTMSNGRGADVISLDNNVIRMTPTSKQATGLFNEFVETRQPSIYKAMDLKSGKIKTLSDNNIPLDSISLYAGIENGHYKVDKLENFDDNTVIYPVRNVRKQFSAPIKNVSIQRTGNDNFYETALVNSTDFLKKHPEYAEKAIRTKIADLNLQLALAGIADRFARVGDLTQPDSDQPYPEDMSNELAFPILTNFNGPVPIHYPSDYTRLHNKIPTIAEDAYDYLFVRPDDYLPLTYPTVFKRTDDIQNAKYIVTDVNNNSYPISHLNAAVLDNKMILGNPNGGVFIGSFKDMNDAQIDSLNTYLQNHPSWIVRPDLGSFDTYRLDNPSLDSYLQQYFEHPKASDPNVFTVGTTTPNRIWASAHAKGGPIHIKPENRGKFTAAANRAGKSVQEYASQILANKDSYSATMIKRANFARNAKKFHH